MYVVLNHIYQDVCGFKSYLSRVVLNHMYVLVLNHIYQDGCGFKSHLSRCMWFSIIFIKMYVVLNHIYQDACDFKYLARCMVLNHIYQDVCMWF